MSCAAGAAGSASGGARSATSALRLEVGRRLKVAAAAAATVSVAACTAGCGLASAGPTCGDFMKMGSDQQRSALIDWAKKHDSRVDSSNPNSFSSGAALFQDQASMNAYCSQPGHSGDHLNTLAPG